MGKSLSNSLGLPLCRLNREFRRDPVENSLPAALFAAQRATIIQGVALPIVCEVLICFLRTSYRNG
jgi:hypothetical protein